jgi:hypothetical protein
VTITRVYLGNPLSPNGLLPLPAVPVGGSIASAAGGMSPSLGRLISAQTLLSGGVAVMRRAHTKSQYQLQWMIRGVADMELLMSFFDGRQGGGPYCLVDPSWRNYLPPNVAGMGSVIGALPEWSPTQGSFTPITSVTPPTGHYSGVGNWATAGSGSILYMGLNNIVDGTWLPPVIPGLSHGFAIWARTASSTATVTPALMYGVGGSAPAGTAATGSAGSLTTTWQQLTVPVASSFSWPSTADYAMLKLTCSTASAPNLYFSAPEFVYDTASSVSPLSPWASGVGVPRVLFTGEMPSPVGRPTMRDVTLTLQEA